MSRQQGGLNEAIEGHLYLFRDSIASLSGARNPHVLRVLSGISGSVHLALEPLMTTNRDA